MKRDTALTRLLVNQHWGNRKDRLFTCLVLSLALLASVGTAHAASAVFLSNDIAESGATYIVQFDTGTTGPVNSIHISLPPGTNAAGAALGRVLVKGKVAESDSNSSQEHQLFLDNTDPDALILDLKGMAKLLAGTRLRIELFNLVNPAAGSHLIHLRTMDVRGNTIENVAPIAYATVPSGDISAVTPGPGLSGGGNSGAVTLNVDTSVIQARVSGSCATGHAIRVIDAAGAVTCEAFADSGGTVTSVSTGSGLTGGPITTTGTISIQTGGVTSAHIADGTVGSADVDSAQIQLRVSGSCPAGQSIRVINADGTVVCESDDVGVTAVTASAPLSSSGGATPNISLPHVIIGATNTAVGFEAFLNNTGFNNTGAGARALRSNVGGDNNTAVGFGTLSANSSGHYNTAVGSGALNLNEGGVLNTAVGARALLASTGHYNTAVGVEAMVQNLGGQGNTATGLHALFDNRTGNNNTAIGSDAMSLNKFGHRNTAVGSAALQGNGDGDDNTALGFGANVTVGDLNNATAIGAGALVDASNKIRLGNGAVTVIEAQVALTVVSDRSKKEGFKLVDGEGVLRKIEGISVSSWNFIGQDPERFRHYGPTAQEFFAAFGHDGVGTIGTPTTINSGDLAGILMAAIQALERRTAEVADLKARLEALERLVRSQPNLITSTAISQ